LDQDGGGTLLLIVWVVVKRVDLIARSGCCRHPRASAIIYCDTFWCITIKSIINQNLLRIVLCILYTLYYTTPRTFDAVFLRATRRDTVIEQYILLLYCTRLYQPLIIINLYHIWRAIGVYLVAIATCCTPFIAQIVSIVICIWNMFEHCIWNMFKHYGARVMWNEQHVLWIYCTWNMNALERVFEIRISTQGLDQQSSSRWT
jgi:hypothetical protein